MEYQDKIFIDTFSWINEIARNKEIVITGAYRVGFLHAKVFNPAIIITHGSLLGVDFFDAKKKLEEYLRKEITILYCDVDRFDHCVFICLGVDHFPPVFQESSIEGLVRATILHDILAAKGIFRADAKWRYMLGMKHFQMFLYVSETSLKAFKEVASENGIDISDRIFISCLDSHSYNEDSFEVVTKLLRDKVVRQPLLSLSVHSVYPYKNIFRTVELANEELYTHYHVGMFIEEDRERWNDAIARNLFYWMGRLDDNSLGQLYLTASAYICSSFEEGFSLGAMEAILLGVPTIVLSDIPAHREIYGDYNVNFVSPEIGNFAFAEKLVLLNSDHRKKMFEKHQYLRTIQPFLHYCKEELGIEV